MALSGTLENMPDHGTTEDVGQRLSGKPAGLVAGGDDAVAGRYLVFVIFIGHNQTESSQSAGTYWDYCNTGVWQLY